MKRGLLLIFTLTIPGASITLWMAGRDEVSSSHGPPTRSDLSDQPPHQEAMIQGLGFVAPVTEIRKLVFKVNGVIARCPAEIGRAYNKGEIRMELERSGELAAIAVAEAEWRLAESDREKVLSGINPYQTEATSHRVELLREQARHCRLEHDRYSGLIARNSVSPSEY